VAGGERCVVCAADGGGLGVGEAQWPPGAVRVCEECAAFDGCGLVEGQYSGEVVAGEQVVEGCGEFVLPLARGESSDSVGEFGDDGGGGEELCAGLLVDPVDDGCVG